MTDQGDMFGLDYLRREARRPLKKCTSCGGNVKTYRRKLNAGMAAILCWLTANGDDDAWVHINDLPKRILSSREFGKLIYWGLLEQRTNVEDSRRSSGFWRTTEAGRDFALGLTVVPSHVFVKIPGGEFIDFEDTMVNVHDTIGDRFDYGELMRGE